MQNLTKIKFWNGNRSKIRQDHESNVLKAVLEATQADYGPFHIEESREDYPGLMESLAFSEKHHDVLITVAGNQKFDEYVIIIPKPIAHTILGYRIPIIRKTSEVVFTNLTEHELKHKTHGIPETWSDAHILRSNAYSVYEKGSFDELFQGFANHEFDYTTFGIKEVFDAFIKYTYFFFKSNPKFSCNIIGQRFPLPTASI